MSWLLLVRPQAEHDLSSARDWYEAKRAGLGHEFLDEVAVALSEMERDPQAPRFYYRNFRRRLLRRFPYKIFYQVIGDRVIIFRVIHAKQDHAPLLPS
jgi:toxin ParE1/3/4